MEINEHDKIFGQFCNPLCEIERLLFQQKWHTGNIDAIYSHLAVPKCICPKIVGAGCSFSPKENEVASLRSGCSFSQRKKRTSFREAVKNYLADFFR